MGLSQKVTVDVFREVIQAQGIEPDSETGLNILETAIENGIIYVPSFAKSPLSNYSQWQHEILTALRDCGVLVSCALNSDEIRLVRKVGEIGMTLNSYGEPVAMTWGYNRDSAISWLKANGISDDEFRRAYLKLVDYEIATKS
jgi:hypothetical protein